MKKTSVLLVLLLIVVVALVGCTESFKQDAIDGPTVFSADQIVSNGGIAVQATDSTGTYLYYINGYAGADGENIFGDAIKGSILRAKLNADGTLVTNDKGEIDNVVIVPKNVYAAAPTAGSSTTTTLTNRSAGLVIDGEYIYYTSPSTNKDKDDNYMTSYMVIMRTKLDGTGTEKLATFSHYNVLYGIYNGYLLYFDITLGELHRIDLDSLDSEQIDSSVENCVFPNVTGTATDNWVFYSKSASASTATHDIIYKVTIDGTISGTELINGKDGYSESFRQQAIQDSAANDKGFSMSVQDVQSVDGKIVLIYKKSDSGQSTLSKGIYTLTLDTTNVQFAEANEAQLSKDGLNANDADSYTKYYFINATNVLCSNGTNIQWKAQSSNKWSNVKRTLNTGDTVNVLGNFSILSYDVVESKGYATYLDSSNRMQKIHLANYATDGTITCATSNAETMVDKLAISTSWLAGEIIGSNVYYFNSDASNYTYAYYLNTLVATETVYEQENAKNRFISIATEVDKASLVK